MKGDFTRDSFVASNNYYRVMMQQGRVQLDADWNEQIAILLHRMERAIADIVGPYGGPHLKCGFTLFQTGGKRDFGIGIGRYYVDGLLCENPGVTSYSSMGETPLEDNGTYVVYLDAWEEYVSPAQDGAIYEPALGGIDTTGRTKVEWRVRVMSHKGNLPEIKDMPGLWEGTYVPRLRGNRGFLAASTSTAPYPGYHGAENQLYRVEIHESGTASSGATFKWSRENGSVAFAIDAVASDGVTLAALGRDERTRLARGDRVEISDDDDAGASRGPRPLLEVSHVDAAARKVGLKNLYPYTFDAAKHPLLRRWDQGGAPQPVVESDDSGTTVALEDGIVIRFTPDPAAGGEGRYRRGDYWLIPARTAGGGSVLWPYADGAAIAMPPSGVRHVYAPLWGITLDGSGAVTLVAGPGHPLDYRAKFAGIGGT